MKKTSRISSILFAAMTLVGSQLASAQYAPGYGGYGYAPAPYPGYGAMPYGGGAPYGNSAPWGRSTPWGGGNMPWSGNNTPWGGGNMPWSGNNTPWGGNNGPWNKVPFGNTMFGRNSIWKNNTFTDFSRLGPRNGERPFGNPGDWVDPRDPKESISNIWDDMLNAPNRMGRMPGGWKAPKITVPNPADVGDEFGRNAWKAPREVENMIQ